MCSTGKLLDAGIVSLVLLVLAADTRAAALPPVGDQPPGYSGAVGSFELRASAAPTSVLAEDPLILTLTVTASGPVEALPRRPGLRGLGKITEHFHVDDLSEKDSHPDGQRWLFAYRLRPRSVEATQIPRLKFVYYKPGVGYQTTYSRAIRLNVWPRPSVGQVNDGGDSRIDVAQRYPLVTAPGVLAVENRNALPPPWLLTLLFLTPPAACLAGYRAWRYWHPDAAAQSGRRRTRAGREALKVIRTIGKTLHPEEVGSRISGILARYLQQRLEMPAAEPTPLEAAHVLEEHGASPALAARLADLLRQCDAVRFVPAMPSPPEDLAAEAGRLIHEMEAEPCLASAS